MHDVFDNGDNWEDICYVSWLWMIRAGVLGLSAYDPAKNSWGQAHSQARYVIYRVLAEAGVCKVESVGNSFTINVDRSLIKQVGIPALKNFLLKLGIYKALADFENGSKMFTEYSTVDTFHKTIRETYIREMKPRLQIVQPTLNMENGQVYYKSYVSDAIGMIESYCDKL